MSTENSSSWNRSQISPEISESKVQMYILPSAVALGPCHHQSMECSMANLSLPIFKFCRWVFYCSDGLSYDNHGAIVVVRGSWIRKAVVVLLEIGIVIQILGNACLMELHLGGNVKFMYRVVTMAYVFYNVNEFWCLNKNIQKIDKVFNRIQQLERDLTVYKGHVFSAKKAKWISWTAVGLCTILVVGFAFNFRNGIGIFFTKNYSAWMQWTAGQATQEVALLFGLNTSYAPAQNSDEMNTLVSLPYLFLCTMYDLHWAIGFLMILMWGVTFDKIFQGFFQAFEKPESKTCNIVQHIRKFHDIAFAIDDFNKVFSAMMFGAILSGSSHFSVFLMTVFKAESHPADAIFTVIAFVLFWMQLLAAAEVSRSAGQMKKVLKNRFHSDDTWQVERADQKTTHGLIMLFCDLSNSNIGFEGLGFFTITYSLIGSVLSLIFTYAIVALQMD